MVRGNWQKRVERTEARRVANKLQKEQRRAKRLSSNNDDKAQRATWYRILCDWLDDTELFPPDDYGDDSNGEDFVQYKLVVDVWTDALPKNRQEYIPNINNLPSNNDDDFEEDEGRGGKGRSKGRSKLPKKTKGKKKAHPNTRQQKVEEEEHVGRSRKESRSNSMSIKDNDKLCAKEFFFGKEKCPGWKLLQQRQKGGKRSNQDESAGCSLGHYHQFPKVKSKIRQSPPLTLARVINGKYQLNPNNNEGSKYPVSLPAKVKDATLKNAFSAVFGTDEDAENSTDFSTIGKLCIGNVYHTRIFVSDETKNSQDQVVDENDDKPHQHSAVVVALEQLFDREKLSQTSLTYLTIQGILVYDLNRGGLVISGAEEDFLETGEELDVEAFLKYNTVDTTQSSEPSYIHEELNHHVLYDIMSYLPDEAAAALPQVCKSWRNEVGAKSPQLWKMLLGRRNWPYNEQSASILPHTEDIDSYRQAFISHYVAARDIRSIACASSVLCGESNAPSDIDYAMQRYKSTIGAPMFTDEDDSNVRVGVKVWADSLYAEQVSARALAVYTHDYTLRLYEVVPSQNNSSTARTTKCRQIACVKAVPPSVSQRKAGTYILGGMDLDDTDVVCLFCCQAENPSASSDAFLSIISRDHLACAGNRGLIEDESLREIDICATILDFLLCGADHDDHLQAALHDYFSIGDGDATRIKINVSPSLVSCGNGYVLVHAFITIPSERDEDSDDSYGERHGGSTGHRVFLVSIKKERIVKAIRVQYHHHSELQLLASNPSKLYVNSSDNTTSIRKMCTNVMVRTINNDQDCLNLSVQIAKDGTVDVQVKAIIGRQQISPFEDGCKVPAIVTSNRFITAAKSPDRNNIVFCEEDNDGSSHAVVHTVDIAPSQLVVHDMFCVREEYIAIILGLNGEEDEEDAVAGEWFGLETTEQHPKTQIVVYHISSRQEVSRCPLPYTPLFKMSCNGDTIVANVSSLGFVIAGGDAREVALAAISNDDEEANQTPTKTPKVKKKRLASLASGRKKDGFARGMSMRG